MPFGSKRTDALCFVGRVVPEKGIVEAIEIAVAAGRPLRIAAKAGPTAVERDYFENVFRPALEGRGLARRVPRRARPGRSRRALRRELRHADARVVAGAVRPRRSSSRWRAARRSSPGGSARLPEILRDGVDGFFGDDVSGDGVQGRPRGRPGSAGDPRVGPRPLLGRADDRRLRGGLSRALDAAGVAVGRGSAQRGAEDAEEPEQLAAHRMRDARAALTGRRTTVAARDAAARLAEPDCHASATSVRSSAPRSLTRVRHAVVPRRREPARRYRHAAEGLDATSANASTSTSRTPTRSVASARTKPRSAPPGP